MKWAQKQTGFTIVELLIVVVVIAILAAITIVAYNGISEQARVSGAKSFAAQIKKRDIVDAQGFWSFDECSGSTAGNSGGAAQGAPSVTGTISWSTDTPSGSGCSLSFNGATYLNTGVSLSNKYYMKSAWVKTTSSATLNIVSDGGSNSNSAFYLPSGYPSAGHNGTWNRVRYDKPINDGKWHHVSVEYKQNGTAANGTMTLSVDGVAVAANPATPEMGMVSTSVQLIGAYNAGSIFSGLMDDVMIVVKD